MPRLTLRSPAKLNLFLRVLNKRPDGYHNLTTIFERISLYDELTFRSLSTGQIKIFCNDPLVPRGTKNLVYKVARKLQNDFGIKDGVAITIRKRIPVAAGLAGGSSNAATTLLGLNKIWKLKLPHKRLIEYAGRIGSDVPFFLHNCSWGLGQGRGDRVKPIIATARLWQVVVIPCLKMYSREVFERLNLRLTKKRGNVNILIHYLKKYNKDKVRQLLLNDLESSILAIRPELGRVKERLKVVGLQGVCFSGSGPAVYGIAESHRKAEKFARILRRYYRRVFVVRTS